MGLAVLATLALSCCTQDDADEPLRRNRQRLLSVAEARAFFEKTANEGPMTRSDALNPMPFLPGEYIPHWNEAEASATKRISCVDIPADFEHVYRVGRQDNTGRYYEVPASSKLIVVKSAATDSLSLYLRVSIPDEIYAALYDGNICEMTLNCEDRDDYCGLEYYATTDGFPIAVTRYDKGRLVASVYLFDETIPLENRLQNFCLLFRNMWIRRAAEAVTRGYEKDPEWIYGPPGITFIDSNGRFFEYVDIDGDGRSDAVKEIFSFKIFFQTLAGGGGGNAGSSNGGENDGSGGNSGGGSGGGGNSGGGVGSGGSGGSPGSGGNSGGGSGGGWSDPGDSGDNDNGGSSGGAIYLPYRPSFPVDPTPWRPVSPIFPPNDPEPEPKPCFDLDSVRANPLMEMKILGTKVNGIKGGRYGRGRGRMHNGIDLAAPIGTPVYAMFLGRVTYVVNKYDPNINYNRYFEVYAADGSRNYDAGNRVWIESTTSKGDILYKYFHLNDITITKDKWVDVGDLIGHTGNRGSAGSPKSAGPHLHLEVFIDGKRTDPEAFLYTKFNDKGESKTSDCNKK